MTRLLRLIGVLTLSLAMAGAALAAEPIEGDWLTAKGATVSIAACDAEFCLTGAAGKDLGKVSGSGGHYEGSLTNPDNGKSNAVKIDVSGDTLTLSGCAGIVCASRDWTRQ